MAISNDQEITRLWGLLAEYQNLLAYIVDNRNSNIDDVVTALEQRVNELEDDVDAH